MANEALAIADTVSVPCEGRVVHIARPQTLYDEPINRNFLHIESVAEPRRKHWIKTTNYGRVEGTGV